MADSSIYELTQKWCESQNRSIYSLYKNEDGLLKESTFESIKRGNNPEYEMLKIIANELHVSLSDFFKGPGGVTVLTDKERIVVESMRSVDSATQDMMDLSGMDFSYAEMKGVNLGGANLTRANLSHANLWGAYLHNIDLTEAMLDETVFINANLTLSKLNGCKGEKTRFTFVCMWDCEITNASLKKADFLEAKICNCDFTGSDLEEAYTVIDELYLHL